MSLRCCQSLALLVLSAPLALLGAPFPDERPLSNADVLSLARAELGDEVLLSKIQQTPTEALDVSTDALIALKKAGLSKPVIDAMIKRVGQRASSATPASTPAPVVTPLAKPAPSPCKNKCCVDNFSKEGSFARGTTFRSFLNAAVERGPAFDRAAQAVAALGWQITSTSKEAGIISGTFGIHQVIDGAPAQATLGVTIGEGEYQGIHVAVQMFGPSGTKLLDKEVQKDFCKIFAAIQP